MTTLRELVTKVSFDVKLNPLENLQRSLEQVQGRLNILAGAEVLRGLQALGDKFGSFALDLQNTAQAVGLTTTQYQKLTFAAEASGVSQDALAGTLANLNKQLYDARLGNEQVGIAFAQAGIKPEQLASFENAQEALLALGKSLNAIKDPVMRAAAAEHTLGPAGTRLLESMRQTTGGFWQLAEGAEAAGGVIQDFRLNNLADMQKTLKGVAQQVFVLSADFVGRLAPSLKTAAQSFSDLLAENRELIATTFEKWTYNIGYAMGFAYGVIRDAFNLFKAFMETFPNAAKNVAAFIMSWMAFKGVLGAISIPLRAFLGILKDISQVFGVLATGGGTALKAFLWSVGIARGGVVKLLLQLAVLTETALPALSGAALALGAAIEATPIGWLAAGLAAVVLASQALWKMWHGANFEETWLGQAWVKIKDLVGWVDKLTGGSLSWLANKAGDAAEAMGSALAAGNQAEGVGTQAQLAGMQAAGALQAAQQPQSYAQGLGLPQAALATQAGAGGPVAGPSYTVNAPMTINVPAGTDPKAVEGMVRDGIADHLDSWLRQTQAVTTPYAVR